MTAKDHNREEMTTRDAILMLLSDDETASVSTAETALELPHGAEYLDLDQLDRGIQEAAGKTVIMGRVLPRKAVHEPTWAKIKAALATLNKVAPQGK